MTDHLQLRIAQSRTVDGKLSLRAMEDSGGYIKDASVRDKLTERFEEGTVVRLVPEDEYQVLLQAQAERDHLRRALEWLNEQPSGCIHPDGECYDIAQPGDLAPDCHPCRMAFAMAAAAGRDLRAFWNEWVSNGNDTTAALAATEEAQP